MRLAPGVLAVSIVLLGAATADADVLDEFQQLDERGLTPAPLVPTTAPRALRPLDRTLSPGPSRRSGGYSLRLATPTTTRSSCSRAVSTGR